jgi:peptide/nickel transport system permease protein
MFAFIIRRVLQAVFVMLVISLLGFAIKQSVGDPVREITGISVSAEERESIREELGLNDPFLVQWLRFLGNAVQGDLGNSFYFKRPVFDVIIARAPATLELVFATSILVILFSVPIGIYAAVRPTTFLAPLFHGRLHCRRVDPGISHRHPAHLRLLGDPWLAALVWPR